MNKTNNSDNWVPKVGMEIYIVPTGSNRYCQPRVVTISKVGRKFFYIKEGYVETPFYIESKYQYVKNYNSDYKAYLSKSHYDKNMEIEEMRLKIRDNIKLLSDDEVETVYKWIVDKLTERYEY